jgi:hypothetical protein
MGFAFAAISHHRRFAAINFLVLLLALAMPSSGMP